MQLTGARTQCQCGAPSLELYRVGEDVAEDLAVPSSDRSASRERYVAARWAVERQCAWKVPDT